MQYASVKPLKTLSHVLIPRYPYTSIASPHYES